jgi:SAM-dependent methyltransferase
MNTYVKKDHLSGLLKTDYDALCQMGYGDLNPDALWKWAAVLATRASLGIKPRLSVEAGGGYSPLHHIFSYLGKVVNVDTNFNNSWFPVKDKKYIKAQGTPSKPENIMYKEMSFDKFTPELPTGSVDFVYDVSSIICFDKVAFTAKEIFRILKPGGFFVSASDVCAPRETSKNTERPWLTAKQIIEIYTNVGLKQYGDVDWSTNNIVVKKVVDGTFITFALFCFQKPNE